MQRHRQGDGGALTEAEQVDVVGAVSESGDQDVVDDVVCDHLDGAGYG